MAKVVYNACFGGFSLSEAGMKRYAELGGIGDSVRRLDRNDPALIQVVEELGEKANGSCAELKIATVPTGALYRIDEYDGAETVMTIHDYDWSVAK